MFRSVSAPAAHYTPACSRGCYPVEPGKIEQIGIRRGDVVRKGDMCSSPSVVQSCSRKSDTTEIEAELTGYKLARVLADPQNLVDRGVLQSQLLALEAKAGRTAETPIVSDRACALRWNGDRHRPADACRPLDQPPRSARDACRHLGHGCTGIRCRIRPKSDLESRRTWLSSCPTICLSRHDRSSSPPLHRQGATEIDIPQLTSEFHGEIAVHPQSTT
jgi:putative peptide zinc metalloprotease protein